jgi:hypothetical protein
MKGLSRSQTIIQEAYGSQSVRLWARNTHRWPHRIKVELHINYSLRNVNIVFKHVHAGKLGPLNIKSKSTALCKVFCEKLIVTQAAKRFPYFCTKYFFFLLCSQTVAVTPCLRSGVHNPLTLNTRKAHINIVTNSMIGDKFWTGNLLDS